MITRIREVRRAHGLTLDDVARRCDPPTTAQTIGRLETGTRTVSIGWLNRIARALGVEAQDLVDGGEANELPVAAVLGPAGAPLPAKLPSSFLRGPMKGRSRSPLAEASGIIGRAMRFGANGWTLRIMPARSIATCSSPGPRAASCSAG